MKKKERIHQGVSYKGDKAFQTCLSIFFILLSAVVLAPVLHVIAISFSSKNSIILGDIGLFPKEFTLEAYGRIFENESFMNSFLYSLALTIGYTALAMFMTILAAYPLSRSHLKGRSVIMALIVLTMYFDPGTIPNYLNIRNLGLLDTVWALIFAQCSFWAACIFAGIDPFPLEVMKGIIVRNLEWWMDRKIFDRDGILTIGYGYANLMMSENYNAPGSPYWAMKTFLVLALPDDHPFWGAEAGDLPALPALRPLPRAEMLMQRRENDAVAYTAGVCELYGHGHLIEKYSKFAYSTAFGFSCQRSGFVLEEACPDSMLAFVLDSTVFVRKRSDVWRVEEDRVYSEWSPMPGLRVRTTLYPTSWGHVRQHEITNTNSWEYAAYDCGFSVPRDLGSSLEQVCQGPVSAVRFAGRSCIVFGQGPEAEGTVIGADPNTNLIYPNTCIPAVKYRIGVGKTTLITRVWTQALTGEDGVFQSSLEEDAAWVCAAGEEPQ